jgi:hypothetical protein
MVNHLSDLVRVHTTGEGTVVRAYFALRRGIAGNDSAHVRLRLASPHN